MAVTYTKYRIPFADIEGRLYRIEIYDKWPSLPAPDPIILAAGDSPLVIDEDDSDNLYTPIRSQTGTINICTRLQDGSMLDVADLAPANNTSTEVIVEQYLSQYDRWKRIWVGYLSCEMYDQAYVGYPDAISLPIISSLESLKYTYDVRNLGLRTVSWLIGHCTGFSNFGNRYYPQDGSDVLSKIINTSLFIEKKEYINEESHTYNLEVKSFYEILETICKFMGWTCRQQETDLYFELMQGNGLANTTTMYMEEVFEWRGTGHRKSIRQGCKVVQVSSKLEKLDIDTKLPGIPFGDWAADTYKLIGQSQWSIYSKTYVYFLASADTQAYSNLSFNFYAGSICLGDTDIDFYRLNESVSVYDMVHDSIPYANELSGAYQSLASRTLHTDIYAGACLARMQFDKGNEPDQQHSNTKDGLFVSLFPCVWQQHTYYDQPIFEMRSVKAFAAVDDGYFNLQAAIKMFTAELAVGTTNPQHKMLIELQVGGRSWNGSYWETRGDHAVHFYVGYDSDNEKWYESSMAWNSSMGIDKVDGLLIPTFDQYIGGAGRVQGEVILRIYPETKFYNKIDSSDLWRNGLVYDIFFESIDLKYIPKKSSKLSDQSENKYRRIVSYKFDEEVSVENDLASWNNNNSSISLLFNADDTPMQKLTYNGQLRRPESDLLNRMEDFYKQPRTILSLEAGHVDVAPLPRLRLEDFATGKIYAPVAESRDFKNNVSTFTCIELPQE